MRFFGLVAISLLALSVGTFGGASLQAEEGVFELQAANPQPKPEELEAGLAVHYAYGDVGENNELANAEVFLSNAENPEIGVLPHLNFENGPKTLTSGHGALTLAQIDGYVRLAKGQQSYTVWSNDGVRIKLGGALIYNDDDRHPCDNALGPVTVNVPEDGWYEVSILYFNRNGTSCLVIEDANEEAIPAESLAHQKKQH